MKIQPVFEKWARIGVTEVERINCLLVNDQFRQCIKSMLFSFLSNASPPYMNDMFKPAAQHNTVTRKSLLKNQINLCGNQSQA